MAIINNHIKCSRESYDKFIIFFESMATTVFSTWDIINPIRSLNFKWYLIELFDKRQVTSNI